PVERTVVTVDPQPERGGPRGLAHLDDPQAVEPRGDLVLLALVGGGEGQRVRVPALLAGACLAGPEPNPNPRAVCELLHQRAAFLPKFGQLAGGQPGPRRELLLG